MSYQTDALLTRVSHVAHGVLESPDNGVQHQFELGWRDGQECREALGVDRLQQVEEVRPVLRVLLKVLQRNKHTQTNFSYLRQCYWLKHLQIKRQNAPLKLTKPHLINHIKGTFKNGIEYLGDFSGDVTSQFVDNGRHGTQNLWFSGCWDIPLVVNQDSLQQWRDKVLSNL